MRKLLVFLLTCLLLCACAAADESDWVYEQRGNKYYLTGYIGTETIATCPTMIDGFKIAGAVPGAFADTSLTDVRLDEFVPSGWFDVYGDSKYGLYQPCTAKYYQNLHPLLFYKEVSIPSDGSTWSYTVDERSRMVTITGYLGTETVVEMPTTVDGKTVEEIAPGAFKGSTLENILFNGYLGKHLSIGNRGFTIHKPDTSLYDISERYRMYMFEFDVTDDGVLYMLDEESNTAIFCGLTYNSKKISVPAKIEGYPVTHIADYAFDGQHALKNVTFPKSVVSIGAYAFSECIDLEKITIPDHVLEIGRGAFSDCDDLTSVTLPKKLTVIPDDMFTHCESLTKITIPGSVVHIGNNAFLHTALKSVTIPASVQSVGDFAFVTQPANKSGTLEVTVQSPSVKFGTNVFGTEGSRYQSSYGMQEICWVHPGIIPAAVKLTCYPGSTADMLTVPTDSLVSMTKKYLAVSKLPVTKADKISVITADLYAGRSDVYSITVPNGVTEIADGAFANMPYLYSVKLPASVTKIGAGAFEGCSNLQTVAFGKKLTVIGDAAFRGCTSLEEVKLPSSVTIIGHQAFADCASLSKVTLPKSITKIGNDIFLLTDSAAARSLTVTCSKGSVAALWMIGNYPDITLKVK